MLDKDSAKTKPSMAPNPALKFWREMGQGLVKDSVKSTEDAGKQIIGVAGILEGLYFHAITYSNLCGNLSWWEIIVYILPIALWLVSLWFALSIFFPRPYAININSSEISKQTYEMVTARKLRLFRVAAVFLGLGVVALIPSLVRYLAN